MSNSAIDLVMLVIEQGETYQAPQAARAVDADVDLAAITYKHPRCCICKTRPSAPRATRQMSTILCCNDPACQRAAEARRRADNPGGGKTTGMVRRKWRG